MGARLSPRAREVLRSALRRKWLRDSLRAIDLLNREGVDFAVIKGPALASEMPGRDFGDLDIIVGRESLRKACGILIENLGYSYEHPEELALFDDSGRDNVHDISLIGEGLIPIEVHFRMLNYLSEDALSPLADKVFIELDGVKIPCQSPELQLLEAIFHNVYHHFFICERGKWIRDINLASSRKGLDWRKFESILERTGQKGIGDLTLRALSGSREARLDLPAGAVMSIRPRSALGYLRRETYIWALKFIWDRLFPQEHVLRKRFGLRHGSRFLILAYPRNWARLAGKLLGMP